MQRLKGKKFYIIALVVILLGLLSFGVVKGKFFTVGEDAPLSFEWLVEPKYDGGSDFQDGVAWVSMRGEDLSNQYTLIDRQGKILKENFEARGIARYTDRRALFTTEKRGDIRERWGYLNTSGDVVIPPQYDWGTPFSSGMAAVCKGDRWGFIDLEGNIRVPLIYEGVRPYSGNLGGVIKNGKLGFVDKQGKMVVDFVFDIPSDDFFIVFHSFQNLQRLQPVRVGSLLGLIDEKGKWIAKPEYEQFYGAYGTHDETLIGAQKEGKVGFLNGSGDVVIDFQFDGTPLAKKDIDSLAQQMQSYFFSLYRFSEGLAVVLLPSKQGEAHQDFNFGVIDEKGTLLFKMGAYPCSLYKEGILLGFKKEKNELGFIDRKGNWFSFPSKVGSNVISGWSPIQDGIIGVRVKDESNVNNSYMYGDKTGYLKVIKNGGGI